MANAISFNKSQKGYMEREEGLTRYYDSVAKYNPFTLEEEQEIFQKLSDAKESIKTLNEIKEETFSSYDKEAAAITAEDKKLTVEDCIQLEKIATKRMNFDEEIKKEVKKFEDTIQECTDKIVCHNQRLVISMARNYAKNGSEVLDLIEEGNIGLIEAIANFNPGLGYKFSTYSTIYIRKYINLFKTNNCEMIRQTNRSKTYSQVARCINAFEQENLREPTPEELLEQYNKTYTGKLANASDLISVEYIHIDECADDAGDNCNNYIVQGLHEYDNKTLSYNDYEYQSDNDAINLQLEECMSCISDIEKDIVKLHAGIGTGESLNFNEVGIRVGLGECRTRQLYNNAIRKMKKYAAENIEVAACY